METQRHIINKLLDELDAFSREDVKFQNSHRNEVKSLSQQTEDIRRKIFNVGVQEPLHTRCQMWLLHVPEALENAALYEDAKRWQKVFGAIRVKPYIALSGFLSNAESLLRATLSRIEKYDAQCDAVIQKIHEVSETIPTCDEVVLKYLEEGAICLNVNAVFAATVMIGCASERSLILLIEVYARSIKDVNKRTQVDKKFNKSNSIAYQYKTFKDSCNEIKNKPRKINLPDSLARIDDLETWYRTTRNEAGHPKEELPKFLDKTSVLRHFEAFPAYLDTIYKLIKYFKRTKINLR